MNTRNMRVATLALLMVGCQGLIADPPESEADSSRDAPPVVPPGETTEAPVAATRSFVRLTRTEYAAVVQQALGLVVDRGVLPNDGRVGEYTSNATTFPDPVHPYLLLAEELATDLVPDRRAPCGPDAIDACVRTHYASAIEALFRRPLTDAELSVWAGQIEALIDDGVAPVDATRAMITTVLISPDFLFRQSVAVGSMSDDRVAFARGAAERLSFALWDQPADADLRNAAQQNAYQSGWLSAQADRMVSDPRTVPVLARFIAQWLEVDTDLRLDEPDFAQSPRFLELIAFVEYALRESIPVTDLVNGRTGFVHPDNVDAYGPDAPGPVSGSVIETVWAADSVRRGVMSQDLFADSGRHPDVDRRPIFRGKLIRLAMLCQPLAMPNPELLEMAQDVTDRVTAPACASCHRMMDPIGEAFAVLDPDFEGPAPTAEIFEHEELEGQYEGLPALLDAIAGSNAFAECFAEHWLSFVLEQYGREVDPDWVETVAEVIRAGADLTRLVRATAGLMEIPPVSATAWCTEGGTP